MYSGGPTSGPPLEWLIHQCTSPDVESPPVCVYICIVDDPQVGHPWCRGSTSEPPLKWRVHQCGYIYTCSLPRLCLEGSYFITLKRPGNGSRPGRFPRLRPLGSPRPRPAVPPEAQHSTA